MFRCHSAANRDKQGMHLVVGRGVREAELRGHDGAVARQHHVVQGIIARRGRQILIQQAVELCLRTRLSHRSSRSALSASNPPVYSGTAVHCCWPAVHKTPGLHEQQAWQRLQA